MFHSRPQKLRKTIRRSTGMKVVLKKLAIGHTLYESKMRPKSSCSGVSLWVCFGSSNPWSTYVSEILADHSHGLTLHDANQDEEHGLVQQGAHGDALRFVNICPKSIAWENSHL